MSSFEEQEIALLRQRIVRLEAQVEFLFKHLGVSMTEDGSPAVDPRIIEALKKNNSSKPSKSIARSRAWDWRKPSLLWRRSTQGGASNLQPLRRLFN